MALKGDKSKYGGSPCTSHTYQTNKGLVPQEKEENSSIANLEKLDDGASQTPHIRLRLRSHELDHLWSHVERGAHRGVGILLPLHRTADYHA